MENQGLPKAMIMGIVGFGFVIGAMALLIGLIRRKD